MKIAGLLLACLVVVLLSSVTQFYYFNKSKSCYMTKTPASSFDERFHFHDYKKQRTINGGRAYV